MVSYAEVEAGYCPVRGFGNLKKIHKPLVTFALPDIAAAIFRVKQMPIFKKSFLYDIRPSFAKLRQEHLYDFEAS